MSERAPNFDPSLFAIDHREEFNLALLDACQAIVDSTLVIERRDITARTTEEEVAAHDTGVAIGGIMTGIAEGFGLSAENISTTASMVDPETWEAEAEAAREAKTSAEATFIGYVEGYQQYMADKLDQVYDDKYEIQDGAWRAAWNKIIEVLAAEGGVLLPEVADYFDALVKLKYPHTFDPMEKYRGRDASLDTSSRTFCEVFERYLPRASQRSGDDSWTGH
jgi:hypothetical protein